MEPGRAFKNDVLNSPRFAIFRNFLFFTLPRSPHFPAQFLKVGNKEKGPNRIDEPTVVLPYNPPKEPTVTKLAWFMRYLGPYNDWVLFLAI
jgi:hypothetical protein